MVFSLQNFISFYLILNIFYDSEIITLCQVSLCQVPLTFMSFKAIIWNLIYGEFDRLHVSLSFGWLAYLEVVGGSWICGREQVEAVGWSNFSVNGAPNWCHYHFFATFDWNIFFHWMPEMYFLKNVYNFSELS